MSLNQAVRLSVGLTGLTARIECLGRLTPAGFPDGTRAYWDSILGTWSGVPVNNLPVTADPHLPTVYLLQINDELSSRFPDDVYRITVITEAGDVIAGPNDISVFEGSDIFVPSYTYNVKGGTVTIGYAKFNPSFVRADN